MGASDYVTVPSPTQYGPPLINFGAQISSLPDSYYQGAEQRRDYDLKRAFQKEGIPRKENGELDLGAMSATMAKMGGADEAIKLATTGAQMDASRRFQDFMSGGGQPQPQAAPQPQQQTPRPTAPVFAPKSPQPQLSSMGTDNEGASTAGSVASEMFGGRDIPALPRIAQGMGVQMDTPLSPQQVAELKQRLQPGQQRLQQQPQAAQPQPQQALQQQTSGIPSALVGLVPQGWTGGVQRFRDYLSAQAASPMLGAGDRQIAMERLKAIDAAIAQDAQRTPAQKDSADPIVEAAKLREEQNKDQVTRYGKRYDAIAKKGEEAANELPQLELAAQVLQDGAYTGPGEGIVQGYKRLYSVFGGDPNKALEQDAFHKLLKNQVLSQIRGMAGTGPVRVMEMKTIDQAVANASNSLSANRMIVDIGRRVMERDVALHQMATNYKGGRLDAGFDQQAREYTEKHPMFTKQELADPRMIAPLIFKTPDAVKAAKLPSGTPFKTPDGQVRYVP